MNIFDNNVGLYFYSAVLQANTALIAFAAVFAVFRFQAIVESLHHKDSEITSLIEYFFARIPMEAPDEIRFHFTHLTTLRHALEEILANPSYNPPYKESVQKLSDDTHLEVLFVERTHLLQKQRQLKALFRLPLISVLIVIVMSLCLLPLSNYFHNYLAQWEYVPIVATILTNIWSLVINVQFVFRTINE